MERLSVTWRVPARDGNTCYRPDTSTTSLRDWIDRELGFVDDGVRLEFEETLITASDEGDYPQLLIEGCPLEEWTRRLGEEYRQDWETEVKPVLRRPDRELSAVDDFLRDVLDFILESKDESHE